MKIYLCLFGLFLALGPVRSGDHHPVELIKHIEECEKEIGVTSKGQPNFDDPKIKCLFACLMRKQGFIVNGRISPENAVERAAKHITKAEMIECANKANEKKGECEVGVALYKCLEGKHPH